VRSKPQESMNTKHILCSRKIFSDSNDSYCLNVALVHACRYRDTILPYTAKKKIYINNGTSKTATITIESFVSCNIHLTSSGKLFQSLIPL
jgi:hypothetical protein